MPASIGVNLRVTGHCRQGGRKYMEDFFSVAYQQTEDERDLEYAFFGIYDGHGGAEAAAFAKEHLMETIIKHKTFWSENDEDVLRAIKDGYIATHYAMWKEQEKWPRTSSGLLSTAGTTASVAFIRRGKIYIGHVGDSGIILGYQDNQSSGSDWKAKPLTRDHKPENLGEMRRIYQCGGKVVSKSGVPRVVWNRPKMGHQGPVRRSTPIDEIPFLAVARSLGDLWSYNSQINQFIVSPDPDCSVFTIDTNNHRCLIFGTDGLFNMLSPQNAVYIVQTAERHNEKAALSDAINKTWLNPSKLLVEKALDRWHNTKMRADNTSVVTLMLDPPGPPRAQVLKNMKKSVYPDSGLKIMTRFDKDLNVVDDENEDVNVMNDENEDVNVENDNVNVVDNDENNKQNVQCTSCENHKENAFKSSDSRTEGPLDSNTFLCREPPEQPLEKASTEPNSVTSSEAPSSFYPLKERNFSCKPRESTSFDPREVEDKENFEKDTSIQINEISSSSNDFNDNYEENNSNEKQTHNLRSHKKSINTIETRSRTRKIEKCDDGLTKLRKSSRLSDRNDKLPKSALKDRISIAQRILRNKKLSIKKKVKAVTKRRLFKTKATLKRTNSTKKSPAKNERNTKKLALQSPSPKPMPKKSNLRKSRSRRLRQKY